jgi:uncharacterized peroxidase-related enzyme
MPWIRVIPPAEAEGRLKELYARVASKDGQVDNVLQIHSLRPRTLDAHLSLYKAAMHSFPCDLSLRERELVGTFVSWLNGCDYCVQHHLAGLSRIVGSDEAGRRLFAEARGEKGTALTARERVMLDHAHKLALRPAEMAESDIAPLREAGLGDAAILDLNQVVAYFAYVNRLVLGLGVSTGGEVLGLHPGEGEGDVGHA